MSGDLNSRLLVAHAVGDKRALVTLYCEAADASSDQKHAGFFLTHAWIFALEAGDPRASEFHRRLVEAGRAD